MADNPKKRGKIDRVFVALGQRHERRYWRKRLGCRSDRELWLATRAADSNHVRHVRAQLRRGDAFIAWARKHERKANQGRRS